MNKGIIKYLWDKHSIIDAKAALQSYAKWRDQGWPLGYTERYVCRNFAQFVHFMKWREQNGYSEPKVAVSLIVISKHSGARIKQRGIANPNGKWLTQLSKEEKGNLPRHETHQNDASKTFFYCKYKDNIYILESKGVKQYILVTCFKK